eukprot:TRINITY_DN13621_c0_g2_i1.p1 TRINITY_DN13621_c0_g2~~TRINITY_DN13621_c0_g2_i1.p1  ORF type:complete len:1002 (+),score=402.03 TRINITY_DN13621_c0_g2_i1:106-3111(+)
MISLDDKWEIPPRNTCGRLETAKHEAPYEIDEKQRRLQELVRPGATDTERYARNTLKEEMCLEFVENFKNQYCQLYPHRAPLLLSPKNETRAVRKFICTFLRPTQLPYSELYDWESMTNPGQGCALYIANYVKYEPLARPHELPEVICSPSTTLKWQVGDCFDLSILLCSLLLGTGYDAYVVIGYASREVCENDLTRKEWSSPGEVTVNLLDSDDPATVEFKRRQILLEKNKYSGKLKQRPTLVSDFDEEQKRKQAQADAKVEDAPDDKDKDADADEEKRNRVHCWVMMKGTPGKRCDTLEKGQQGMQSGLGDKEDGDGPPQPGVLRPGDAFFIEPSTGLRVEIDDQNYYGVESVFNDENYWVNMQCDAEVREGEQDPRHSRDYFELRGAEGKRRWEPVFLGEDKEDQGDDHGDAADAGPASLEEDQDLMPPSWVQHLTLSRRQYENRYPGMQKTIRYSNATVKLYACYSQVNLRTKRIILMDQWEEPVEEHEFYQFRSDKLKRRSIYPNPKYLGDSRQLRIKHEWFAEGRRSKDPAPMQEALAEYIVEEGLQQTMKFYSKARLDGLKKRVEVFWTTDSGKEVSMRVGDQDPRPAIKKIMEYYEDRDDRLIYRSATFDKPNRAQDQRVRGTQGYQSSGMGAGHEPKRDVPYKMTEKFARNEVVPADQDCAKRSFITPRGDTPGSIKVEFHYDACRITRSSRHYCKDGKPQATGGSTQVLQVETVNPPGGGAFVTAPVLQPHMKKPKQSVISEELRGLYMKEKKCLSEIEERRGQVDAIVREREAEDEQSSRVWPPGKEEHDERHAMAQKRRPADAGTSPVGMDAQSGKKVAADITVYDILRNQTKESVIDEAQRKEEDRRRAEQRKDYLAPYLNQYNKTGGSTLDIELKPQQASEVKNAVLRDLKERLIQRAHIMQNRLDKEKEELARTQQNFHKSQEQMSEHKEHEQYIRFVEDAMWRISILEKRLERHQDQALQKYANLDTKLRNDPRLKEALAMVGAQ